MRSPEKSRLGHSLFLFLVLAALIVTSCAQPPAPATQPPPAPTQAPPPTAVPPTPEPKPEDIKGSLTLYTAANEVMEAAVLEGFQKKYPGITIERVNMSSGPIASRVLAEMDNPKADVIWGLFESYMMTLREKGAIEPYKPKDFDAVDPQFVDPDGFYTGHDVTLMGWAANTQILTEKGLDVPLTWEDLVKEEYKGMVSVASPAQSGTGMTFMTCLYDMNGGWDYIDKLNKNIFQYNSSGGASGRQAARGEVSIGMTYDTAILGLQGEGFPVQVVFPPNDCYTVETSALINKAPHPETAKLFLDYLISKEGMFALAKVAAVLTRPDVVVVSSAKPQLADLTLYKMKNVYDLEKFANDWLARYSK